eukprot:15439353-Alexandrium_andersonii.AAC.1
MRIPRRPMKGLAPHLQCLDGLGHIGRQLRNLDLRDALGRLCQLGLARIGLATGLAGLATDEP